MTSRLSARRRVALVLACALATPTVFAQSNALEAEHTRGIQLRAAGQDAEAAEVFRGIFERTGEPRALARLGLAEGALQRWSDADEHLQAALSRASDPWIVANRANLEAAHRAVRTHLGFVTVLCTTPGATVQTVGGTPLPLPLQAPLRVTTGFVDLTVRAPGHAAVTRHVAVPVGQEPIAVEVTLVPEASASVAVSVPVATPVVTPVADPPGREVVRAVDDAPSGPREVRRTRAGWQRPVGIGLLAGAGVALGVGVVGVIVREGAAGQFNDGRCRLHPDRDEITQGGADCADALSRVETGDTLALGGFVSAGVLGVAGVALTLFAPRVTETVRVDVAGVGTGNPRASLTIRF